MTGARHARRLGVAALLAGAQPLPAQDDGSGAGRPAPLPIAGLRLARCVADRALPCVRVRLDAAPAQAAAAVAAAAAGAANAELARWGARLGPYTLQPVAVRPVRDGVPRAVLTLVDVSGSMATNGGAQVARAAVRSFVRDLGAGVGPADSALVRAAVAPFASRGVAAAVRGAAFGAPAAAAGAVDRLPAPAGNTGLYAAVLAGAERVAAEARALGPDARAALVVVTDGRNDVLNPAGRVRPGDDPGLATGAAGRAAAAAAARRLGVPLFLIGVGSDPDMTELGALAGEGGLALRTAIDAVALREALAGVDRALTPGREVWFAAPGVERASLARPGWPVDVVRTARPGDTGPGARATHWTGRWPAPVLAAPLFDGAAFGDGGGRPAADAGATLPPAPAWLRAAADDAPALGRRGLVAVFVAALAGAAWWLPRALWRPAARETLRPVPAPQAAGGVAFGAVAAPATGAGVLRTVPLRPAAAAGDAYRASADAGGAGAGGATAAAGGVRPDVREAPARRPADVTASGARRRAAPGDAAAPGGPSGGQTFAVHRTDAPAGGS